MATNALCRVRTYSSPNVAQLAHAALQNHGLECAIDGDQIATTLSYYGHAVNRVNLLVHADDAARAREILDQFEADLNQPDRQPWDTQGQGWVCAECREVNAMAFDECWSCHRNRPDNPEFGPLETDTADIRIEKRPGSAAPTPALEDDSPYRVPRSSHAVVKVAPQKDLIRRTVRASIIAAFFAPLVIYSLYLVAQCLAYSKVPQRIYWCLALNIATLLFSVGLALAMFAR